MVQPLLDAGKGLPGSRVSVGFQVLGLCQTCPCKGRTINFKSNGWALRDVTSFFCILQSVSLVQSGRSSMEIGVLYLSYAMLVLAELIVCSTRGFANILAKRIWPAVMSLVSL